jgi:CRP-like cAMP-binding protein
LFLRLSEEERGAVIARLRRRQAAPGELIFTEGHPSNAMFVVTAGLVKLESGPGDHAITLANLGAGSLLGEVDTLLSRPYSASARSAANTQLLSLSRTDLEDLISQHPNIGLKFSAGLGLRVAFLEQHLVQHRLRSIELLSALSEEDLCAIARQLDFRSIACGDIIVEAGAPGEAAFFIEEGAVRLITQSGEGEWFDDLEAGALFGHTALITGKPYPATARAVTDVNLWVLSRAVYQDLIYAHPAIKLAFSRALAESLSASDQSDATERMSHLQLFADVPTEALSALAARLVLRHFPTEEAIYTEGTPGDAMYIVESGEVKLMDSAFSDAHLLERIRPGEAFGEMALLTGRTRAECARAASDTTLWVLYKSDFDDVMVQYPEISVSLSHALTTRLSSRESDFVVRHLRRITLFSNLTSSDLRAISLQVRGLRFRPGEIICFSGQPAHALFMIENGTVKRIGMGPSGEPIMLDMLGPGESFGEQAIVQNTPYNATAQALDEVEVWTISKADFLQMLEEYPVLAITITRLMADRLTRAQQYPTPPTYGQSSGAGSRPFVSPSAPAARTSTVPPPARRIQQPPSGARPIAKPTPPKPAQPSAPAPKPRPTPAQTAAPRASHMPHVRAERVPHVSMPHVRAGRVPHVSMPHTSHQSAPSMNAPHPLVPRAHRNNPHKGNSFLNELGGWLSGLSTGAKLRTLVLGALVVWITFIAFPVTTVSTVSSGVGGLQVFNPSAKGSVSGAAVNVPAKTSDSNPIVNRLKVAFAIPTDTPVPTPTPRATATPRPPTRIPPTRTPMPAPTQVKPIAPLPPVDWDQRLGNGSQVLAHLQQVRIIPATVTSGQKFWRAVRVKFEDVSESGNDHTIYVKVLDENGKRVNGKKARMTSEGGLSEYPDEKPEGDMCDCNFNYPMYGDGYGFQIEDQYPSDRVAGMIMPMRRHVNYRVTFQLVTMP